MAQQVEVDDTDLLSPSVISMYRAEGSRMLHQMSHLPDFDLFHLFYFNLSPDQMRFFNNCAVSNVWQFFVFLRRNGHVFDPSDYERLESLACRNFEQVQSLLDSIGSGNVYAGRSELRKIVVEGITFNSYGADEGRARLLFDILALSVNEDYRHTLLDQAAAVDCKFNRVVSLAILDGKLGNPGLVSQDSVRFLQFATCLRKFVMSDPLAVLGACVLFDAGVDSVLADCKATIDSFGDDYFHVANKLSYLVTQNNIVEDHLRGVFQPDHFSLANNPRSESYTPPPANFKFDVPCSLELKVTENIAKVPSVGTANSSSVNRAVGYVLKTYHDVKLGSLLSSDLEFCDPGFAYVRSKIEAVKHPIDVFFFPVLKPNFKNCALRV